MAEIPIALVFQVESANEPRLAPIQAGEQLLDFLFALDFEVFVPFLDRLVLSAFAPTVDGLPTSQGVDRHPSGYHHEVREQAGLSPEAPEDLEIVVDDLGQDVRDQVIHIRSLQHHGAHLGRVVNGVVERLKIPIDKIVPGGRLAGQTAVEELRFRFGKGQGHGLPREEPLPGGGRIAGRRPLHFTTPAKVNKFPTPAPPHNGPDSLDSDRHRPNIPFDRRNRGF